MLLTEILEKLVNQSQTTQKKNTHENRRHFGE